MLLEHLGENEAAPRVMQAIEHVTADPALHTGDLGGKATTAQVTAGGVRADSAAARSARLPDAQRRKTRPPGDNHDRKPATRLAAGGRPGLALAVGLPSPLAPPRPGPPSRSA